MKSATRFLMLIGAGILTTGSFTLPAQAATPEAAPVAQVQRDRDDDDDWDLLGYHDSRRDCERVGNLGESRDWWDDHNCVQVRRGPHRGDWELSVQEDRWGHDNNGHPGGPRSGPR
ncbi:MAG: hypothetical protein ABW046_22995 [Actinoplanes sp.]